MNNNDWISVEAVVKVNKGLYVVMDSADTRGGDVVRYEDKREEFVDTYYGEIYEEPFTHYMYIEPPKDEL